MTYKLHGIEVKYGQHGYLLNSFHLDEWDGDSLISVDDLIVKLQGIKKKYGGRSVLSFDAGYNNVSVEIVPSKKKMLRQ
jgi:hypothetical protein